MAETRLDKITTVIAVTKDEMLALLAQKAQDAGLLNYVPDSVEINPTVITQDDGQGTLIDIQGYEIEFTGPRV